MKKKLIIGLSAILAILIAAGVAFYVWQYNLAYHECYIEAGIMPTPNDFLKKEDLGAFFAEDSATINPGIPGDYNIVIKTSLFTHKSLLHIQDTIAPTADSVSVVICYGETAVATDFVNNVTDATEVKVDFENQPDFGVAGRQEIKIAITDLGGNKTIVSSDLYITSVKDELIWEVGEVKPSIDDFLLIAANAVFVTDMDKIDYQSIGSHKIKIKTDDVDNESLLTLVDTVAPVIVVKDISTFTNVAVDINDFIVSGEDVTEISFSYEQEPDLSLEGEQTVIVVATDKGGNETKAEAKLILVVDNEPPVIKGLKNKRIRTGSSVAFKNGVTVTDNNPEGINLSINTGGFNCNQPGEYTITYTATDASGNKTVATITITVIGKEYTEEHLWSLVDPVLASILTPGMSQRDKLAAIYKYVRANLRFYSGSSTKINWIQGAVDALSDRTGDCYMYACMSKALMERAGIENILIVRSDEAIKRMNSTHYWNIVNVEGEGWLHFDALPLRDGTKFFLVTDAEIEAYHAVWPGYHEYNRALYPDVN